MAVEDILLRHTRELLQVYGNLVELLGEAISKHYGVAASLKQHDYVNKAIDVNEKIAVFEVLDEDDAELSMLKRLHNSLNLMFNHQRTSVSYVKDRATSVTSLISFLRKATATSFLKDLFGSHRQMATKILPDQPSQISKVLKRKKLLHDYENKAFLEEFCDIVAARLERMLNMSREKNDLINISRGPLNSINYFMPSIIPSVNRQIFENIIQPLFPTEPFDLFPTDLNPFYGRIMAWLKSVMGEHYQSSDGAEKELNTNMRNFLAACAGLLRAMEAYYGVIKNEKQTLADKIEAISHLNKAAEFQDKYHVLPLENFMLDFVKFETLHFERVQILESVRSDINAIAGSATERLDEIESVLGSSEKLDAAQYATLRLQCQSLSQNIRIVRVYTDIEQDKTISEKNDELCKSIQERLSQAEFRLENNFNNPVEQFKEIADTYFASLQKLLPEYDRLKKKDLKIKRDEIEPLLVQIADLQNRSDVADLRLTQIEATKNKYEAEVAFCDDALQAHQAHGSIWSSFKQIWKSGDYSSIEILQKRLTSAQEKLGEITPKIEKLREGRIDRERRVLQTRIQFSNIVERERSVRVEMHEIEAQVAELTDNFFKNSLEQLKIIFSGHVRLKSEDLVSLRTFLRNYNENDLVSSYLKNISEGSASNYEIDDYLGRVGLVVAADDFLNDFSDDIEGVENSWEDDLKSITGVLNFAKIQERLVRNLRTIDVIESSLNEAHDQIADDFEGEDLDLNMLNFDSRVGSLESRISVVRHNHLVYQNLLHAAMDIETHLRDIRRHLSFPQRILYFVARFFNLNFGFHRQVKYMRALERTLINSSQSVLSLPAKQFKHIDYLPVFRTLEQETEASWLRPVDERLREIARDLTSQVHLQIQQSETEGESMLEQSSQLPSKDTESVEQESEQILAHEKAESDDVQVEQEKVSRLASRHTFFKGQNIQGATDGIEAAPEHDKAVLEGVEADKSLITAAGL